MLEQEYAEQEEEYRQTHAVLIRISCYLSNLCRMPKKLIKRYMPDHRQIREHKHLQLFGSLLHDPNLWHLNRRSAAGAFAVGLFVRLYPFPCR